MSGPGLQIYHYFLLHLGPRQDPGYKYIIISDYFWDLGRTGVGPRQDLGYKYIIISYYFWDPGRTWVGPGQDPGYKYIITSVDLSIKLTD